MKMLVAVFLLCCCELTSAAEFDNSLGFGVQYGGVFGWQGSLTDGNVHGRIAFGVVGASLGVDVNANDYVSVGVTIGSVVLASHQSININYYPSGNYTEGWRIGLDIGAAQSSIDDEDEGNFVGLSFGYSFR